MPDSKRLLSVEDLHVSFPTDHGIVPAVRGVSWEVDAGETLVIVGESGSGKSVSVTSVAGLLPRNAIVDGRILFRGEETLSLGEKDLRRHRAENVGLIFQDPLAALNPVFTVGEHLAEIFRVHRGMGKDEAWDNAVELLEAVQIRDPERRAKQYPHELSGGMRQRVVIAMAISLKPPLLLADEPTTALDTSVRGEILRIITSLRDEMGMGVVLITHDVGVAAAVADRVAVMYAGELVEFGATESIFHNPTHPYTKALMASMPRLGSRVELQAIKGLPPSPNALPTGCPFHPRCPIATDLCTESDPELAPVAGTSTLSACHYAEATEAKAR